MALSIDWLYRDIFQIFDSTQVEEFFREQQLLGAEPGTDSGQLGTDSLQGPDSQADPAEVFQALSQKIEAHGKLELGTSINLVTLTNEDSDLPDTLPTGKSETDLVATEGSAAIESAVSEAIRSVDSALDPATSAEAKNTLTQVAEVIKETAANADDPASNSVPAETANAVMKLLTLSQLAVPELRQVYEAFIRSSFPEDVAQEMVDVLNNPYYQVYSYRFAYGDSAMESRFSSALENISGRGTQGAFERSLEEQEEFQHKDNETRRRQAPREKISHNRRDDFSVDRDQTLEKDSIRQFDLRNLTHSNRRV